MRDKYIIAEVGANHQGELELAKKYILEFARAGASAIKFQARSNKYLFSPEAYARQYDNENSFGRTYGEHREYLEFSEGQYQELREYCRLCDVDFAITAFDEVSLDMVSRLDVSMIKVASFDCANIPFLNKVKNVGKPVVLSTGGCSMRHIEWAAEVFKNFEAGFSILQCVSDYPCPSENLNLQRIVTLKNRFPEFKIGLSDHFNGILSGPIAAMLGATVFEKHVTFNRGWKGTDHKFALELEGFRKFVRDIRRVPQMLGDGNYDEEVGSEPVFQKLGKVLIAVENIPEGMIFSTENIRGQIVGEGLKGIPVRDSQLVLGQKARSHYRAGEVICNAELD